MESNGVSVQSKRLYDNRTMLINPPTNDSDDSDIEGDLVTTINENIKGFLENDKTENVLQLYYNNHQNLPSTRHANQRRLSQCREEDEEEEKRDANKTELEAISGSEKSLSESSSNGSKSSVIDTVTGPTHKFVVTKTKVESECTITNNTNKSTSTNGKTTEVDLNLKDGETVRLRAAGLPSDVTSTNKSPVKTPSGRPMTEAERIFATRKYYQSNTVHFPTTDPSRPSVYNLFSNRASPLQSPHYDSRYFDSSLIAMKSQTSSSSTIDCGGSVEDVWVKRNNAENKRVS